MSNLEQESNRMEKIMESYEDASQLYEVERRARATG